MYNGALVCKLIDIIFALECKKQGKKKKSCYFLFGKIIRYFILEFYVFILFIIHLSCIRCILDSKSVLPSS